MPNNQEYINVYRDNQDTITVSLDLRKFHAIIYPIRLFVPIPGQDGVSVQNEYHKIPLDCNINYKPVCILSKIGDFDMKGILGKLNNVSFSIGERHNISWSRTLKKISQVEEMLFLKYSDKHIYSDMKFNQFEKNELKEYIELLKKFCSLLEMSSKDFDLITKELCNNLSNKYMDCLFLESYALLKFKRDSINIFKSNHEIKTEYIEVIDKFLKMNYCDDLAIKNNKIFDKKDKREIFISFNSIKRFNFYDKNKLIKKFDFLTEIFSRIDYLCFENIITDEDIDNFNLL